MQELEELELELLPFETAELAADPYPYFAKARKKHSWLAQCSFGYVIHQYDAIKDFLLANDDKLRGAQAMIVQIMDAEGTPWGRMASEILLTQEGETHRRQRKVLTPLFTPKQANANRELMQQTANRLLDEWAPKGSFDFEEFVSNYPIGVMCAMLGSPREAIPELRDSLETLGLSMSMDPAILPQLQEATIVIDSFGKNLVAERRAGKRPETGGELLDVLIKANDEGEITDQEFYNLMIFLYVGGYDTSKNVLTLIMYELLQRPEMYKRCAEDLSYCKKVVDETMRYHNVAMIPRITTADIEFRDVKIPSDCLLFFPVNIAGRDPSAFEDPDTFDPDNIRENKHMGFGRGSHICLGQFIARAQIEEGLHQFAKRIKNPRLAGEVTWRPFYGVWGLQGLPIEFDQ